MQTRKGLPVQRAVPSRAAPDHEKELAMAAYAAVWQSFAAPGSQVDHRTDWAAWAAGRCPHLLLLVRVRGPAARSAAQTAHHCLGDLPGVELQPSRFLHITVQSLGFLTRRGRIPGSGELAPGELPGVVARLEMYLAHMPRFGIALGAMNAFRSAAFLEVLGWTRTLGISST